MATSPLARILASLSLFVAGSLAAMPGTIASLSANAERNSILAPVLQVSGSFLSENRLAYPEPAVGYPLAPRLSFAQYYQNPLVEEWIAFYTSGRNRGWVQRIIDDAASYITFFRSEINGRGLPPELMFLPGIESSFRPDAVSRSGARGMWQFMTNSIEPYDMRVSRWADERRDLYKSTRGALSKLAFNYSRLNDWLLAIAAYNSGLGGMERLLAATGSRNFWEVRPQLRKETADYIPKFLAMAAICMYPEHYGFKSSDSPLRQWEFIPVKGPVNLNLLALKAGIKPETMRSWHPELNYWSSPPDRARFILKIPSEYTEKVMMVIQDPEILTTSYAERIVRQGDTLFAIARAAGVSVETLILHNPGIRPDQLQIGQVIMVPAGYGETHTAAAPQTGPLPEPSPLPEHYSYYIVQPGDTLWAIGRRFAVAAADLAAWNGLQISAPIHPGLRLKIPASSAAPGADE